MSVFRVIYEILKEIGYLIYLFYRYVLPFLVRYIGVPLFIGGCLLALGFSGAVLIVIVAGTILYFKYIKKITMINPLTMIKKEVIR